MFFVVDFHIHSKYSGGTSQKMDLEHLSKYCPLKGLNLIGTGDITHPEWLMELKEKLTELENTNLYSFNNMKFLLTGEVNNIFEFEGKTKQIHHLFLVPSFEVATQLNDELSKYGDLSVDGRPDLRMTPAELLEIMKNIDKNIECIPAHIWTPHFSLFGSRSGFNSIKDCYQDKIDEIHALETGLSSDPPMNWRISELDKYILVSNSDCHSPWPWRVGREANIFNIDELTYSNLINAIRKKDIEKFQMTIEVDPAYGKYHFDGHRKGRIYYKSGKKLEHEQGIRFHPTVTMRQGNLCPICGKLLTVGVLHRVEELADREDGYKPEITQDFRTLIPLSEIIATMKGITTISAKGVWSEYQKLVNAFGNEFEVLLNVSLEELINVTTAKITEMILKIRQGQVHVSPGYDGVYGELMLYKAQDKNDVVDYISPTKKSGKIRQMSLDEFK
ncbi:MAG: endonuclease Q family protein [Promethearchaeota archaeon]